MAYAPAHRPPRGARPWLYLAVVLTTALLIGLVAWWTRGHPDEVAGRFDPMADVTRVRYGEATYLTQTEILRLPDAGMMAVGTTAEGFTVYVQRAEPGHAGGGGGAIAPPAGSFTRGPAYLKTVDGRFVPLVLE